MIDPRPQTELPLSPQPVIAYPNGPKTLRHVIPGEYWGAPSDVFQQPRSMPRLMVYLKQLERRGFVPAAGKKWPWLWGRPAGFDPVIGHARWLRQVWRVKGCGVVIKYDGSVQSERGNQREAQRAADWELRTMNRPVRIHVPVWGITPAQHFLVMPLVDVVADHRLEDKLRMGLHHQASVYFKDPVANGNAGAVVLGKHRYWLQLDLDKE